MQWTAFKTLAGTPGEPDGDVLMEQCASTDNAWVIVRTLDEAPDTYMLFDRRPGAMTDAGSYATLEAAQAEAESRSR